MDAFAETFQASRFATPKPLYAQVRDLLLGRVKRGEWGAGECLPNEFVLSKEFKVSIGTIRRAVAELESSGVLVRKQGRGTYVAGAGPSALAQKLCGLRHIGGERLEPCYALSSLEKRAATANEAKILRISATAEVAVIVQVLSYEGQRIGFETSVVPAAKLPRLETQLHFGQCLYSVFADYGMLVTRVEETIGIELADHVATREIAVPVSEPLLAVERVAITLDDLVAEVRSGRYIPRVVRYAGLSPAAA